MRKSILHGLFLHGVHPDGAGHRADGLLGVGAVQKLFAKDRYETLDQVVSVAKRTAEYLVNSETMPQGAELDALNTKLEIIGESAEAYLFSPTGRAMCSLPPTRQSLPPAPCRWTSASAPTQWLTRTPGTTTLSAIWAVH